MRISTSMMNQSALNGIETAEAQQLAQTQAQLSTGKSINSPADDPVGAVQLLQLNNVNSQNTQYISNVQSANTNLTLEEQALSSSTTDIAVNPRSGGGGQQRHEQCVGSAGHCDPDQLSWRASCRATPTPRTPRASICLPDFRPVRSPLCAAPRARCPMSGIAVRPALQVNSGTSVQTGDPGSSVFMNIQGGNGTFGVSAATATPAQGWWMRAA